MDLKNRPRNRSAGFAILVGAVIVFLLYAYFLIFTGFSIALMQATMLAAVGVLLTLLGWIGYTMLSAPRAEEAT